MLGDADRAGDIAQVGGELRARRLSPMSRGVQRTARPTSIKCKTEAERTSRVRVRL